MAQPHVDVAAGIPAFPFHRPEPTEPPVEFARLRAERPVCPVELPSGDRAWLVTRYDDVRSVFTDARFSRNLTYPGAPRLNRADNLAGPDSLSSMDPPRHTRLRRLVAGAFTARRVDGLRPRIERITDGLVDDLLAAGPPADLVADLAFPLTITVICALLGAPDADRDRFREWSDSSSSITKHTPEMIRASAVEFDRYLAELIERKRAEPGDDLISAMIAVRDGDGDRLTESELRRTTMGLIVAGNETTVSAIALGALALIRHPGQRRLLLAEPALINSAVEEVLRHQALSDGGLLRVATADVPLGGVTIARGDAVLASPCSANRDRDRFPDPDTFDITREQNAHLAFTAGPHFCLGAALARQEMRIALGTLVMRLPGLRLAVPESELPWRSGVLIGGPSALPVAWDEEATA